MQLIIVSWESFGSVESHITTTTTISLKMWLRIHLWSERCWVRDPAKIFSTSKFRLFTFFATLHIKLKLTLQTGGGVPNHLDQSSWSANQKHGVAVRSYLLHFSPARAQLCFRLCQPNQILQNMQEQNHFPELNQHMFGCSSSNFNMEGDILRTTRDDLITRFKLSQGIKMYEHFKKYM